MRRFIAAGWPTKRPAHQAKRDQRLASALASHHGWESQDGRDQADDLD